MFPLQFILESLFPAGFTTRLTARAARAVRPLLFVLLCAFTHVFCNDARATPPAQWDYVIHSWQVGDNGLPENNVTSVLQTRDGYIWLGTRSGLARFDGVRFTVFDANDTPEMHSSHVTCLFEAQDGTLWVGYADGDVLCYKEGKFREAPIHAAWHVGKIVAICADSTGDIWLLNQSAELARARDGFSILWPSTKTVHLLALTKEPHGGIWIQRDNDVSLLENARLKPLFDAPSDTRYVQGICAARDGGLWVLMENCLRKWKENCWTQISTNVPWDWAPSPASSETKEGYLAVATADHGLFLVSPEGDTSHFSRTNGLASDWVNSFCEDREGNFWVGTGNGGLAMLKPVNVKSITPEDQWQGRAVMSVATAANGALWAGTEGAGLYCYQDGTWTNFADSSGLMHRYVWSVAPDFNGEVLAGTWGSGVYTQQGDRFDSLPELTNFYVAAIQKARSGGLFVGTSEGLIRYENQNICWLAKQPELNSPDVRAICENPDGSVWFGMFGGGLALSAHGTLKQFHHADGLSSDFIQCLHLETDGTLWIGTFGGGLTRLKQGKFSTISKNEGLPSDVICDIQDDGQGFYWMSSHNGLIRVAKAELNHYADQKSGLLNCLNYGLNDGLPSLECSGGFQPAGCRTSDGRLWFPTSKGLVGVDPINVRSNSLPPPVVIEDVSVDDVSVASRADDADGLQIAPGRHRLEFDYSGLSFIAPEKVRFKYRLDSLDHDWVEAGAKRLANYSYIPPGQYNFRVIACNNDGVWNDAGASFAFVVLPYFWQRWEFQAVMWLGAVVLAGLSVLVFTRRRMHAKLERMERQQALERERTRIARDIHDDLGASLTRISMLTESARGSMDDLANIRRFLDQIFLNARESTRAMADIVWAVNPSHDTLDSLATYLQKFAQNFLRDANIRCRLDIPLELPLWPLTADIRHNLLLAFKEAVNNVVRHASANEVRISLKIEANAFALIIEDNGRGFKLPPNFDPLALAPETAGNGLKNMALRLSEIGGRFQIASTEGAGTRVTFFVAIRAPGD